jgi:hypothetical protein
MAKRSPKGATGMNTAKSGRCLRRADGKYQLVSDDGFAWGEFEDAAAAYVALSTGAFDRACRRWRRHGLQERR